MVQRKIDKLREVLKGDIIKFVKLFADTDPLPYQEKFLKDSNHYQIFVGGRRVGKSFVVSMKALHYAWTHPNKTALIVSASKEQAQETFRYILNVINHSSILKSTLVRKTQTEIEFDNGSRIKVVPAGESGKSVRGYTADMVIIDEAAYVPDSVFDAIEPTIATQIKKGSGYFILLGSPAEPKGAFYDAWNSDTFSKHHATTYDNPYVDEKWIEEFKKKKSNDVFKREILGEFASTDETFFNIDAVRNVAIGGKHIEPDADYDYYFGIDFAMSGNDETVIAVVGINRNLDSPKIEMVNYFRYKNKTPSWIVWKVKEHIIKWKPKRIYVDSTGLGYPIYQLMKERLGEYGYLVHGINFSSKERDEMFYFLRELIEDEQIVLLNDNEFIEQFLSYTVKVRADGQIRIAKKKRAKDDITDALALAVWGVKKGSLTYTFMRDCSVDDLFPQKRTQDPFKLIGMGMRMMKF